MHNYRKNYPRPQLVREDFTLLDGEWKFAFDDKDCGERDKWDSKFFTEKEQDFAITKINVPFSYETKLSGIGDTCFHPHVWYSREFELDRERLKKGRIILNFEGVDYYCKVWINGQMVGDHTGGYTRFSFDISNYVREGKNIIVVKASDNLDNGIPRGKQRWTKENFGCWYVQTTGIWKSVWLEATSDVYIKNVKITPNFDERLGDLEVCLEGDIAQRNLMLTARTTFGGEEIDTVKRVVRGNEVNLKINVDRPDLYEWGMHEWRPDSPELYDVELFLEENYSEASLREQIKESSKDFANERANEFETRVYDKVYTYFGMRQIKIDKGNILLNGAPIYQKLILDQGYWKDSALTPPSEEAILLDIETILKLGFNGVRKHQKTEDERFLYWCDVKGVLVWSEVPAAYAYSDSAVSEFTRQWLDIVRQFYSHPCIITWTPFNESWGIGGVKFDRTKQHFTEAIYHLTKSLDPYRPVIVNDGWEHTVSDIITLHDYEEDGDVFFERYSQNKEKILNGELYHCHNKSAMAEGFEYMGQPIIISEYGGIAFNEEGGWGYGNKVNTREAFVKRFDSITTAIKKLPYVCGYCYTQVSDVEQEINGLMDQERNCKINPELIKEINDRQVL